jgi:hypothetical protein
LCGQISVNEKKLLRPKKILCPKRLVAAQRLAYRRGSHSLNLLQESNIALD